MPKAPKTATVAEDENHRLGAGMAAAFRAAAGEPEPDLAHLFDERQVIALLKAAPDGLTGRQLDMLLPGRPTASERRPSRREYGAADHRDRRATAVSGRAPTATDRVPPASVTAERVQEPTLTKRVFDAFDRKRWLSRSGDHDEFVNVSVGTPKMLPRRAGLAEEFDAGRPHFCHCRGEVTHGEADDRTHVEVFFTAAVYVEDLDVAAIGKREHPESRLFVSQP